THLVVDLAASFTAASGATLNPMVAGRISDSRTAGTALAAGETFELPLVGGGLAPADTVAAALNVTVTDATDAGYLTVHPCGQDRPEASNVNFAAGTWIANHVTASVGDGAVCFSTSASIHLVVDVAGTYHAD
ncbi:MAG: hypothetical protein WD225_01890, partial [Ilumatobacteraceae bacterium]